MLRRGTAARATANFYLMPGTAALMAWALLGESLAPTTVAGLVVSSVGCWLMGSRRWAAVSSPRAGLRGGRTGNVSPR
jgi:drug/metabolite transporter (DMT)-like permease